MTIAENSQATVKIPSGRIPNPAIQIQEEALIEINPNEQNNLEIGDGDDDCPNLTPLSHKAEIPHAEKSMFGSGEYLLTLDMFGYLKQWNVNDHKFDKSWGKIFQNQVDCMAITPDGKYLFIAGSNGNMKQWHIKQQNMVKDWGQIHKRSIYCMVIMPTSDFLFSAGIDKH